MIKAWKDYPEVWDNFYQDQDTRRWEEIGFPSLFSTKIVLADKPKELSALQSKIDAYWQEYAGSRPEAVNGKMYATTGRDDLNFEQDTLLIRAYQADYATLLVKLSTQAGLTLEERAFLDAKVRFLGVTGFIQDGDKYLAGQVAKRNMKQDLWETIPMGSIDYGLHEQEDPFRQTLEKEAKQETNLDLAQDFDVVQPWGFNFGPQAGNGTIIYRLQLHTSVREKIRCSAEHLQLRWTTREEVLGPQLRYTWNPVTVCLMEKLEEEDRTNGRD